MTRVRYHEAAEDELLREVGFLERRARGLGRRFMEQVRIAEDLIAEFPHASPEVRSGIRRHSMRSFPCALVYAVEDEAVLILAVAHHRRRPDYWLSRA